MPKHSYLYPTETLQPFWRVIIRPQFLIVSAVLLALSSGLASLWIFRYPNLALNERLLRSSGVREPHEREYTGIVYISAQDHRTYFEERSPLNPAMLRASMCAILVHEPAVLVMDFQTSHPDFQGFRSPLTSKPIIWARPIYRGPRGEVVPHILGVPDPGEAIRWAFAVAPIDPDRAVRSILRSVQIDRKTFPTLHTAALSAYREMHSASEHTQRLEENFDVAELSVISYGHDLSLGSLAPKSFLNLSPEATQNCASGAIPPNVNGRDLKDRIVFFGGQYDFADRHATAFGDRWGVELLADGVEAEIAGLRGAHISVWQKLAVKIAIALLIAYIFHRLKPMPATLAILLVLVPVVAFGSALAVLIKGLDGPAVPFLVGILIEQIAHSAKKGQELAHHDELGAEYPKSATL